MNYKEINDYEQLYLISENDDAKNIIFTKYKPIVISIANKYNSFFEVKGVDMDDLIQEGYIGLSNAINAFNEKENALFYTFCILCIERQIRSYCKKYTSNKNEILNNAYSIDMENEDNNKFIEIVDDIYSIRNPDIHLNESLFYKKLIEFKNNLSLNQSLVFELRYNGFKYKEIATLLDISVHSVDNYIHICKSKFTKFFA